MSDPSYPEDVRQYDGDPRSPFYEESPVLCFHCDSLFVAEEVAELGGEYYCEDCEIFYEGDNCND